MTAPLPARPDGRRPVVLMTGLSGAGLSTALKALEDAGYEAVDNLPLSLLPALVKPGDEEARPLAVVVDSRTRAFTAHALIALFDALTARPDLAVRLVFMDSADDVLQRRFTETRRRHPQAMDRPVMDGIQREREMLWPLRMRADLVIDSSLLSTQDLRRLVAGHLRLESAPSLFIFVTSFSYRLGIPREADLVFDVRFLTNPYWDPKLKPHSGLSEPVRDFVLGQPAAIRFLDLVTELIELTIPGYRAEGKEQLRVAIGCTGGYHRSIVLGEELATRLAKLPKASVAVFHRELER
jgi:RNase adapter protein RapZ